MNPKFLFVLLILSTCCLNALRAQTNTYNFAKVDIENGLSHNQVYAIYRDSTGFVWLGTASGLNRYDGYNCKVFINVAGDSTSLPDNYVADIFPLPAHKLWIGSKSTASIFDPTTETFDSDFKSYLKTHHLPQSKPLYSVMDKNGNYWFLFEKEGLYRYTTASQTAIHFVEHDKLFQNPISNLSLDASGNLWLVYSNGYLEQIDVGSLKKLKATAALQNFFGGSAYPFRLFADRQGKLWTYIDGDPKGAFEIDPVLQTVRHFHKDDPAFRLNNNLIKSIAQDKKGAIWVGTDHGGINVINEANTSQITYLLNKENDKNSLSYNCIEKLYADNAGIMWAGTGKKGASYFNENIVRFEKYTHVADEKASLPFNDVNYFVEDRIGNVWIGTNGGGLLYFDRSNHHFTQYVHDPANPNSLSNDVVVSLCLDHENKLWIGTYTGGLDVFDGKVFTHYRHNPADPLSIPDDRIWHILEDHNHVMWIGTLKAGLCRFDRPSRTFTRYDFGNAIPKTEQANYIPVMQEDRDGNLWVGTWEGIEVLNSARTQFTYYPHTVDPSTISSPNIIDIVQDKRGLIWIGTRNGLNVFDPNTKKVKRFCMADGLPDDAILTITEDKNGNLWLTTPKGLCQLMVQAHGNNVSFEVRNFTRCNNVQGPLFNESARLTSSDGAIFEGGSTGFNIIDPQKIVATKNKPRLVFTNIEIFNNEVAVGQAIHKNVILRKALPFADAIRLAYDENIFSIEFAALDFSGNNQYAYKLEGFNKNWMYTNSSNRKVTYTNLDPGTYVFKVKATNSDGVWSNYEKTLTIIITPPFWKTPLAFLIYVLAAAGLLYLARHYTLEKARMRFEVEQQRTERERIQAMDAMKTKFFTNVSHEFRTPLSLILTPLDRIIRNSAHPEQKKQLQLVQRNAKRLLNLVNQLLDFRKLEVQEFKLQPTEGDIVAFIKEGCCSFSDIAEMKRIQLSFASNTPHLLTCFDKDKLEKILFNLLSNAFKYTPAGGAVDVQVSYLAEGQECVKIRVRDTGIGIPADKQEKIFEPFFQNDVPANTTNPGTGIGLVITKEFVKLHNGTISVVSEPEQGTEFIVTLPVIKLSNAGIAMEESHEVILPLKVEINEEPGVASKPVAKAKPVILLVEDNDDFRFYLKDNLSRQYEVVETANGQEAWERLEHVTPHLIVSDVMMPYMDGIELTKRVKKTPALFSVPIILLTAVEDEELQLESYRLGVSDYMTKPFTYEILDSRIKNIFAQTGAASQKQQKVVEVFPTEIEIQPVDERFLKQVLEVIEKNIANPEFTVEELSRELFMHRAGTYRKLLSLTGLTPLEFIRDIRLKRGRQLLEKSGMTIAEVAYEVGFNNPKKFSQHFKEAFGITPSQFQKQLKQVSP